jgi:hypothetical protein
MAMAGVLVQLRREGAAVPPVLELEPGETITFGRGSSVQPVDMTLSHRAVSRLAGEITATADYWLISNLSGHQTYVVDNPEGGGEHLKIAPKRLGAPVPFEFSRVVIPVDDGAVDFLVYAPEHQFADETLVADRDGDRTATAFSLDETAKYFLILVAMCEPRLRDSASIAIPLIPEIIARLHSLESCRDLTRTAVNFHIDYLAERKLRIRQRTGALLDPVRLDWKREAVVSYALRFDLVREEHLRMLPAGPPTSRRVPQAHGPGVVPLRPV